MVNGIQTANVIWLVNEHRFALASKRNYYGKINFDSPESSINIVVLSHIHFYKNKNCKHTFFIFRLHLIPRQAKARHKQMKHQTINLCLSTSLSLSLSFFALVRSVFLCLNITSLSQYYRNRHSVHDVRTFIEYMRILYIYMNTRNNISKRDFTAAMSVAWYKITDRHFIR